MTAEALFNALRADKRALTGEALAGLLQNEVDYIEALRARWKAAGEARAPSTAPKALRDPQAFYGALRAAFGALSQPQVDGFNALLSAIGKAGWPISWVAYALATAWHETAATMQPIMERGGPIYFKRMYDPQGDRPHVAKRLGNTKPGDGARYAGRGYVQLTGQANYAKAAEKTGAPLVSDPNMAMVPQIAAKILTWGMEEGAFTGKGLGDYLPAVGSADRRQFVEARRIINGQDRAEKIAAEAVKMQDALADGGWA